MRLKKVSSILFALVMVASVFAGCKGEKPTKDPDPDPDKPAEEKILKFGLSSFDGIFNPIMSDNVYDAYVSDLIFENLVTVNAEGEYVGKLATWELSEDRLTYTFTLKEGIKFSDGSDLTTEDVEFTYKSIANPLYTGPRSYAVSNLLGYDDFRAGKTEEFPGIKVIDPKTISFTFKEGLAAPANIECFVYGIMSKKYYSFTTWEEFQAKLDKPLGSGPLVLEDWGASEFIKLDKNDKYWNANNHIKIDGVLMQNVPEDTVIAALAAGTIDFAQPAAKKDNVDAIKAMNNVTLQSYLGNGYTFLAFNTTRKTLSDVKVRQALMYALDRESFIEAEYGSKELARVGLAPISPTSWAFPDENELNPYAYDLDKARTLLDEAGWKLGNDGFRYKDGTKLAVNWLVYTDSTWPGTLSSMAADSWKQIGVDLTIELMDFNTVSDRTMDAEPGKKDFDIYTMGFSLSVDPDPTGALFDADAYVAGGFNATGFRDNRSQELMLQGKTEFDQNKRAEIYAEWAKLQNELIPTIIIAYRSEIWGVNNRVKGMKLGTYSDWTSVIKDITIE